MPHPKLIRLAESEVERCLERLPPEVRAAAEECLLTYEDMEEALEDGDSLDPDLLGLFEGLNRLEPPPAGPEDMPRIRLFLDNLWDFVEEDEKDYRREVRTTWLHELGHYLGWGEEEIEALGLG